MKVLIDIPDTKQGQAFLKRTRGLSYVQKVEKVTAATIEVLKEIKHIKEAHKLAAQVKSGKLKGRPARELLSEL